MVVSYLTYHNRVDKSLTSLPFNLLFFALLPLLCPPPRALEAVSHHGCAGVGLNLPLDCSVLESAGEVIPAEPPTSLVTAHSRSSGFVTETAFLGVFGDTPLDGIYLEVLERVLWLAHRVLDQVHSGGEEEAVVVSRYTSDVVPGHVTDLIRVDVVIPLTGYQSVSPPAVGLGGDYVGLTEDTRLPAPFG